MSRTSLAALFAAIALAVAGCGSSGHTAATQSVHKTSSASTTSADPAAVLRRSANVALNGNYKLAVYVLWHNKVPAWAKGTTVGPALASLRSAAAARQKRGVRVRMLAHRRRILSLQLDPSYATASALIVDWQRVQPSNAAGRPLGKTVVLRERARYELRRAGDKQHFLVWKVVLLH